MVQLGIDIGGTSVKAALWIKGRWAGTGQSAFYSQPTTAQLHSAIRDAAGPLREVDHIGICVPGLLDNKRKIVTLAVNVPGLVNQPLSQVVPHALGIGDERPTVVSNDAAAAAFDVYRNRHLRGRLLVLTLGTGVGNAVLDDGAKLLDIGNGASGHLGQMDVTVPGYENVIGPDGGAGGFEAYIGVAALRQIYGEYISDAISRFTGSEPAIRALVRAVRICHAIYRPNHICLCGGIGVRLKHLLPVLREQVEKHLTSVARPSWTFTCGDDDFHAARGAAMMAVDRANTETDVVYV
jgi:predicted NBD/HSP70 family sugar kinase